MQTYMAILRGINVGGKNKIRMADLVRKLEVLELKNLQTYIQSGNLIFEHENVSESELARQIAEAIVKEFGYRVPVIVYTVETLNEIIFKNPFVSDVSKDEKFLHVSFLAETPTQSEVDQLNEYNDLPNEFRVGYLAIYLYCPNGYSKTKLNNQFFEKKLQVTATTRNWRTTLKLAEMAAK